MAHMHKYISSTEYILYDTVNGDMYIVHVYTYVHVHAVHTWTHSDDQEYEVVL